MKFAKLFELENGEQVLVVKDYDNDKEKEIVRVTTDFNTATASITHSFKNEELQQKMFDTFDLESAKKFRNALRSDFF
jgi:hypothetical protein